MVKAWFTPEQYEEGQKEAFKIGKEKERERVLEIIKTIRNGEIDLRYLEEEIQKEEE